MKNTQTQAESKTGVIVRGVEAHEMGEAEQILKDYQRAVSQLPEVQQVVYKQYGKSIEFIVAVDRIRRQISGQLSRIESRLCNEYLDWYLEFKHIGVRTFCQWSLDGYDSFFSRD